MRVSDSVMSILSLCVCDGSTLCLPPGQLARNDYIAVNKVLEQIGAKWNRKRGAHIVEGDAQDALDQVLTTGVVQNKKQELGFFETPIAVIGPMIRLANLAPHHQALEPSAGRGAIAAHVAPLVEHLDCWEIDPTHPLDLVRAAAPRDRVDIYHGDFLAQSFDGKRPYDRIVMNPPFARGADVQHVMHAYQTLASGGLLVSVMSAGITFKEDARTKAFRALVSEVAGDVLPLPDGSFRSSGTDVNTVLVVLPARVA